MKRLWIIVTTMVVLAALGAGIGWYLGVDRLETVRGVVGSEKAPFFADQRVKDTTPSSLRRSRRSRSSRCPSARATSRR